MPPQLLVVEDDDAIAELVVQELALAGYAIRREADGRQAMLALDTERFDLVLLDLMLPGADGFDVCRHAQARHRHTPVIILSARSAEAHRVLGLELGADDYLVKPFSMLELLARVRALLRRVELLRQPADEPMLRFGHEHRLDVLTRELQVRGSPVTLTLREFDLQPTLVESGADAGRRAAGHAGAGSAHAHPADPTAAPSGPAHARLPRC